MWKRLHVLSTRIWCCKTSSNMVSMSAPAHHTRTHGWLRWDKEECVHRVRVQSSSAVPAPSPHSRQPHASLVTPTLPPGLSSIAALCSYDEPHIIYVYELSILNLMWTAEVYVNSSICHGHDMSVRVQNTESYSISIINFVATVRYLIDRREDMMACSA